MFYKIHDKYIRNRDTIITPELLLKRRDLRIHYGKSFKKIKVTAHLIGHKLGTLSLTKRLGRKIHNSSKNTKRQNKNKHK